MDFLAGGGEMGAHLRAYDWAASPVGEPDTWPPALKTAMALMLGSRGPVYVAWGPDLTSFYNDGYLPIVGKKHPGIGLPFRELWAEIWDEFRPYVEATLAGEAQHFVDLPIALAGRPGLPVGYFTFSYTALRDENGQPAGFYCAATETTDRVLAERRAAEEADRHRLSLQRMPGFAAVLSGREQRFDWVNDAYETITGRTGFVGNTVREMFPELEGQGFHELLDEVYCTGRSCNLTNMEIRLRGADPKWVDFVYEPVRDDSGSVTGIFVGGYEVTQTRQASAALAESEARYRTLLETTETGFCIVQMKSDENDRATDYMIVEGNAAFEEMTGLKGAADKWVSEIAPGLERHWHDTYGAVALTGEPVRFENRAEPFGRWFDVQASRTGNAEDRRVAILFNDITARKTTELRQAALIELDDALAETVDPEDIGHVASRILGQAMRASRVGYGVIDPDARTIRVARDWTADGQISVAGEHRFSDYGTYVDDLMRGKPVLIADVETDPRTAANTDAMAVYGIRALMDVPTTESGRTIAQMLVHSDRPRDWTADEVAFVKAFAERTRAAVARREAEAAVRDGQRELQRLTDNLPLLVAFVGADLRYRFNNRTYEDWFGIGPDELKGRAVRDVLGEEAFQRLTPHIERVLAGEPVTIEQFTPYSRGGGRYTHVEYIPRRDEAGRVDGFYGMVQDITARKQAEMRQQVLLDLNDAIRDLTDPAEIAHASSGILAEALSVSRVGYGVMDTVAETITIERDYNAPGVSSIAGLIHFRDFGSYIEDLARGDVVVFDNAAEDPRISDGGAALAGISATALINLPLMEQGKVVALLFVNNAEPRHWSEEDVALVREVAERVRTATERARAGEAVRQNAERLRFLDDLNRAVAGLTEPDAILKVTTRMVGECLGVSICAYADMDEDQDGFTIRGDWAAPDSASIVGHYQLADFGKLAVQELGAGRPLIINDNLAELPADEAATFQSIGISATICMPLVKAGRLTALMAIHHRAPHIWTDEELAAIREVTERSWAHVERARAEAELRERAAELEAVFEAVPAAIWIARDPDAGRIDGNAFARRLLRMPEGANLSKTASDPAEVPLGFRVLDRDGIEIAPQDLPVQRAARGEPVTDFEEEVVFEDGSSVFLIGNARPLLDMRGAPRGAVASFIDITTRRGAETALRESEAQFRAFAQAVPNHVWASRPDGYLYWFNQQVYAYTGRTEGDLDGVAGWGEVVHPDDLPAAAGTWGRALAAGTSYRAEFRIRRADGEWRRFSVHAEPVRDEQDAIVRWVGANLDIEDIRRQGEELERVNETLSTLLTGAKAERDQLWTLSTDMLARADYGGGLSAVNPAWTRLLGWTEQELLTNPYADIIDPADMPATVAALTEMGETGRPTRFQNSIRAKDGQWKPIDWTVAPEPDGENFIAVGRDLTDDKAREAELQATHEALRQSQKMEAVGQLTGGIAHDFNNLLAGISGSLELLSKRLAEGRLNGMERYIDAAQGASQRAAALTQRLLAFSRRQTLDPRPTDVNRLIAGMEDLIRRTVGPDVQVEVVRAGDAWATLIDQPQLENALLNLCLNGRDAMVPDGGRLTIETSNSRLDNRAARERDLPPGDYVTLSVTDTGTGMTPAVQVQAFDPFFTTKPLGQGTGLGLSMIHGFVRQSGGQVRIRSEVGKGTTMCLHLPRHLGEIADGDDPVAPPAADGGRGETILVIDDEATVRMLVAEVLGEAGYRVIEAPDGPAGLEILRSGRRIDLLITDVGLPGGMNGRQVADAARVDRPELQVLFITGYAENAAVGNGLLAPGMEVLTKPFAMAALGAKVREMIESPAFTPR